MNAGCKFHDADFEGVVAGMLLHSHQQDDFPLYRFTLFLYLMASSANSLLWRCVEKLPEAYSSGLLTGVAML